MLRATMFVLAIAVGTTMALPASAATEEECKAAIAKTQHDIESNAIAMGRQDSVRNQWDRALVEAGGYGLEGEHERCLEKVKEVRSLADLPE